MARSLSEALSRLGRRCDLICTDAFLLPNVVLEERGLSMRKGFPETFDDGALAGCLRRIRAGEKSVRLPVYSHAAYDVVPDACVVIGEPDLIVIEGVNVLQPPAVGMLDASVYVEADEAHVRSWFVSRFLAFTQAARSDETSFYRRFAAMDDSAVRSLAESVWEGINGVNVRDHIVPTRVHATFVLTKGPDHAVVRISGPGT